MAIRSDGTESGVSGSEPIAWTGGVGGRVAMVLAAAPFVLFGLGVATLVLVHAASEAHFDLCWMYGGADEDAVRTWQGWPPGYVCTSSGEAPDHIGVPAALWVPVVGAVGLWVGAAWAMWRFARSGAGLTNAARTASAMLVGLLVAVPAAYLLSLAAVAVLVQQRGDTTFVQTPWWPPFLVGLPIAAGAAGSAASSAAWGGVGRALWLCRLVCGGVLGCRLSAGAAGAFWRGGREPGRGGHGFVVATPPKRGRSGHHRGRSSGQRLSACGSGPRDCYTRSRLPRVTHSQPAAGPRSAVTYRHVCGGRGRWESVLVLSITRSDSSRNRPGSGVVVGCPE
ncbi:MAG TPA: hypothetical protein VGW38_02160 [Chloroflexota bacterium]|nr:hypothetical protein [Chloroflexota bacterium]